MTDAELRLRSDAPAWQESGDVTLLLDLADRHYYVVNGAGSVLWRMLAGGTTAPAMARQLCETFSIERERADADVDLFISQCRSRGYLEG